MQLQLKSIVLLALAWNTVCSTEEINAARNIGSRIIGGTNARVGQYKYAAAITIQTETGRFFCGGALLTSQWILTAGQCVNGATLFTIQLGSNTLSGDDENRVTVATSEYILHPDFNPATLENDVGLIKLRLPVEFTNYLDTVYYEGSSPIADSTGLYAIGWGQLGDDEPDLSDHLNYVNVVSLSNDECKLTYGNQITENMICVSGPYNEGTCIGDTGSPLIHIVSRGANVHAGIASFISANGCQSTDPSGYTRVHPYLDWITNITRA